MSETEYTENGELYPIMIEGLTEKEAAEYKQILGRFLESYKKSDGEQQEFQWLKEQLREELPEKTDQEIEEIKTEIVTSIQEYDNNLKDLNENLDKGKTKESWFAETVMNGSSIAATAEYGQYLQLVSETIENANELMIDTVMTNKYEFSQCKNLDGFIAEQYHVNMFNMKAAIEKSNIRARVLKPLVWIAEKCTNTSLLPSAGVMKPKPFDSLNHLTVPLSLAIDKIPILQICR